MRKLLALTLIAIAVMGAVPITFAASDAQKGSLGFSPSVAGTTNTGSNSSIVGASEIIFTKAAADFYDIEIQREQNNEVYLFLWVYNGTAYRPATSEDIRKLGGDVKIKYSGGRDAIESVTVQYGSIGFDPANPEDLVKNAAYVRVRFIDRLDNTGALDFDFEVFLVEEGGRRLNNTTGNAYFRGTIGNHDAQPVGGNTDYINVYDRPVLETEGYNPRIEIDSGVGLSLWGKVFDGKKYYLYADLEPDEADAAILTKHPSIGMVFNLITIGGLNTEGNYITLDMNDPGMYVYDKDLKLLGTSGDRLPYSAKYYISDKKIGTEDLYTDSEPVMVEPDIPDLPYMPEIPVIDVEDVPETINDNPGTGH